MHQRTLGLAALLLLGTLPAAVAPNAAAATTSPLRFGMDAAAVVPLSDAGLKPDFAMMWAGVWLQKFGWAGFDAQLDRLYGAGVTPVVQFYYWGDDISRACLEQGCWSDLHDAQKTKAGWTSLASALASHLTNHMKGRAAVVIVESEFNKNDAATYEALDGYLAEKANQLKNGYPASQIVLGFGNWGHANWPIFDRAAAASHQVGVQGMRASTRDSLDAYKGLVGSLLDGVKKLTATFHQPVFITDVALSSHTEPQWLAHQDSVVRSLMARRGEFKEAGATGLMYRSLFDASNADTKNYYGEAERHFGLAWASNRTWKPAMKPFVEAMRAERAGASTAIAPAPSPSPTAAPASTQPAVEVEAFARKSVGSAVQSQWASGGAYWNLWSNGFVEHTLSLPSTAYYELQIRAGGSAWSGVGPTMTLEVDGTEVWRLGVRPYAFEEYEGLLRLSAGPHVVRLHFVNDASGPDGDRNLHLDRLTWAVAPDP